MKIEFSKKLSVCRFDIVLVDFFRYMTFPDITGAYLAIVAQCFGLIKAVKLKDTFYKERQQL
jgi:hypothetical protein